MAPEIALLICDNPAEVARLVPWLTDFGGRPPTVVPTPAGALAAWPELHPTLVIWDSGPLSSPLGQEAARRFAQGGAAQIVLLDPAEDPEETGPLPPGGVWLPRPGDAAGLRAAVATSRAALRGTAGETPADISHGQGFARSIIQNSHDCLKVLDGEGRLLFMSKGGRDLMGIKDLAPFLGLTLGDLWGPVYRDQAEQAVAEALAGRTGQFNGFLPTLRGENIFWEVVVTPIQEPGAPDKRLLAVSRDATDRLSSLTLVETLTGSCLGQVGREFFRRLVENLSAWLNAEICLIGRLEPGGRVRTLAAWADGAEIPEFTYELKGSPCEEVTQRGFCHFPQEVGRQFPADALLAELGAQAYVGEMLRGVDGAPLGVLAAISRRPLMLPPRAGELLEIVACRVAAEIQRLESLQSLRELTAALEERVRERTARLESLNQALAREVEERRATAEALAKSERKYRELYENLPDGLAAIDLAGRYVDFNPAFSRLVGYPAAELNGLDYRAITPAPWAGVEKRILQDEVLVKGYSEPFEKEYLTKHGALVPVELRAHLARGPEGEPLGMWAVVRDLSERREAQKQQRMAATVFENSLEGIVVADHLGQVLMVNGAFTAITGFTPEEVVGRDMDVLRADTLDHDFYEEVWESLTLEGRWSGEYWNRRKNGEAYPEWLTLSLVKDQTGRIVNYLAVFYDISELKRGQERIIHQAQHDALTGLPNRTLFNDRLNQALAQAERHQGHLALLFVDLDDFKRVNDSLGHEIGDQLILAVAERIKSSVRHADTVARLGGDEFIILLGEVVDERGAVTVGRKVLAALNQPLKVGEHQLRMSASVGITVYPEDGGDLITLLKNADLAMYRAKEEGGNQCQLFTRSMQVAAVRRLQVENALRKGLAEDQFLVHYQPRVEAESGRMLGMEALVRWQKPGEPLIYPGTFLPVAEDSGLIVPLGEWVLLAACRQAKAWQDQGLPPLELSVNLSLRQFQAENLVATVRSALQETGLEPGCLELEVTESTLMKNLEQGVALLMELARLGVRLSLDDFGTGYSSLYYLKHLPIQVLKIDRSFVKDIGRDSNSDAIVEAIIAMAHTLHLAVVAEGVEEVAQLEFLRRKKCDQVQGFLYSRPLPAEEFAELVTGGLPAVTGGWPTE
ncbi:MAG: EAL domain-containing protein [Deltaproteobacteria bacterium]|nr:EAL domain-containing protein [Deltaproteobacteria bacterium]